MIKTIVKKKHLFQNIKSFLGVGVNCPSGATKVCLFGKRQPSVQEEAIVGRPHLSRDIFPTYIFDLEKMGGSHNLFPKGRTDLPAPHRPSSGLNAHYGHSGAESRHGCLVNAQTVHLIETDVFKSPVIHIIDDTCVVRQLQSDVASPHPIVVVYVSDRDVSGRIGGYEP